MNYFLKAEDIAKMASISMSQSYKLIRKWNAELKAKGFETLRGRVPRQYAFERMGLNERVTELS